MQVHVTPWAFTACRADGSTADYGLKYKICSYQSLLPSWQMDPLSQGANHTLVVTALQSKIRSGPQHSGIRRYSSRWICGYVGPSRIWWRQLSRLSSKRSCSRSPQRVHSPPFLQSAKVWPIYSLIMEMIGTIF